MGSTYAKVSTFGDHRKFEKPKTEQKRGTVQAGEWGIPLRDQLTQKNNCWVTKALDVGPRSVPFFLRGWEGQLNILSRAVSPDLCDTAGMAINQRRRIYERLGK